VGRWKSPPGRHQAVAALPAAWSDTCSARAGYVRGRVYSSTILTGLRPWPSGGGRLAARLQSRPIRQRRPFRWPLDPATSR
jgi:hypothetical protein